MYKNHNVNRYIASYIAIAILCVDKIDFFKPGQVLSVFYCIVKLLYTVIK